MYYMTKRAKLITIIISAIIGIVLNVVLPLNVPFQNYPFKFIFVLFTMMCGIGISGLYFDLKLKKSKKAILGILGLISIYIGLIGFITAPHSQVISLLTSICMGVGIILSLNMCKHL